MTFFSTDRIWNPRSCENCRAEIETNDFVDMYKATVYSEPGTDHDSHGTHFMAGHEGDPEFDKKEFLNYGKYLDELVSQRLVIGLDHRPKYDLDVVELMVEDNLHHIQHFRNPRKVRIIAVAGAVSYFRRGLRLASRVADGVADLSELDAQEYGVRIDF